MPFIADRRSSVTDFTSWRPPDRGGKRDLALKKFPIATMRGGPPGQEKSPPKRAWMEAERPKSGVSRRYLLAVVAAAGADAEADTAAGAPCAMLPLVVVIGSSGTMSSATMLMILISGLTAGPAVSL